MKDRINNILIGLLWLLAVALGASFWFNTKYGFNIFSVQHWQYMAYMQASNQPIRASFYISFLLVIIIAVFGLYKLLQPKHRIDITPSVNRSAQPIPQQPVVQPVQSAPNLAPKETPTEEPKPISPTPDMVRPPRLNIPTITQTTTPVPRVPLTTAPTSQRIDPEQEYADIHEIFTSTGFVYKGSPRIKNVQTSVIAIGSDEVLWIGATGVSTPDMQRAVDTLNGVFSDTLDDIEINVNAFIVGATDDITDTDIMHFASVDDLRSYINAHPNIPPVEDEIENFDAYSGYIGTVIDYIGKI